MKKKVKETAPLVPLDEQVLKWKIYKNIRHKNVIMDYVFSIYNLILACISITLVVFVVFYTY